MVYSRQYGRLNLNWNANSAWDPLLELPVQCWRFQDTHADFLNDNNIRRLPQNIAICTPSRAAPRAQRALLLPRHVPDDESAGPQSDGQSDMCDLRHCDERKLKGITKYLQAAHGPDAQITRPPRF